MAENPEYIGWAMWAAGPFWGANSPCCTDSKLYGSLEPGSTAADGSPGLYQTVWLDIIQPLLPKSTLQKTGISSINGGQAPIGNPAPTSTKPVSTPTSVPTPIPTNAGTVPEYGQCGGIDYTGLTKCAAPFVCTELNAWYFQCLPAV